MERGPLPHDEAVAELHALGRRSRDLTPLR